MSKPREINKQQRRSSIAKLTRAPLAASPLSPSSRHSQLAGSYQNTAFLRDDVSTHSKAVEEESRNSSPQGDLSRTDSPSVLTDPSLMESVQRHLKPEIALSAEGADVTRDIYKYTTERPSRPRSKSMSSVVSDAERRGSFASSLNVPGGFRREFVLSRAAKIAPNAITRNFVEFLSIYGHFAGEDLEDEDSTACHYSAYNPRGEGEPLLPSASYNPNGTATDTKAYFLLVKAFVGTGVLFLPKAFESGGLVFSALTLLSFGLLSYWCYLILVYSKIAVKVSSFGEIGRVCYGPWLQQLILSSIVLSQLGFVAAYIVFTAENLRAFVVNVSSYTTKDLDIFWFILLQMCILTPLSLIRDITKLSLSALLANSFIMVGLVTIVCFTLKEFWSNGLQPGEGIHFYFNTSEFSLFIGVAIFAFEGIGLIIPIQESMIHPNHFPKVLFQVLLTISTIFIFIGSLGYLTFGSAIDTVILLNLPQNSPFIIMIQLLYAFAILLSTPIQIFPAVRLIESRIFKSSDSGKRSSLVKWQKNLVRFIFVLVTAITALYGGQNLNKFVSFVGCFACIPLVYMYPPMLHLKSCCDYKNAEEGKTRLFILAMVDYAIIVVGGIAVVYTTYDIIGH